MFRKVFLIVIVFSYCSYAQSKEKIKLSGNLYSDFHASKEFVKSNLDDYNSVVVKKKSGLLAGVLSAAVPGAGEIYTGNYLKAALFMAVEAAAIYFAVDYNQQGDDQTDVYQAFALKNWDPAKYARTSIDRFDLNSEDYNGLFTNEARTEIDMSRWDLIHKMEAAIAGKEGDVGKYYSHELAPFKDQQYFEMIGKYRQFNSGWNDFDVENNPNFGFETDITKNFGDYSVMRGKANDHYNKSTTFVTVIVVNHVISALDAVLSAKWYNDKIKMNAEVKKENIGFNYIYYPSFKLRYNL